MIPRCLDSLDMTNYASRRRPVFRLKIARDQTCALIEAEYAHAH